MEIKATVEDIIFRNVENGYSVVLVDSSGELVTAVGIFPPIVAGEMLHMQGKMSVNSRFGSQFLVDSLIVIPPTSNESLCKYLSSGLFKGVGERTAHLIVEQFGDKTLDIIENNFAKLAKVKGISLKKALDISQTLKDLKDMQSTILYLQGFEVSLNMAIKIYKAYESKTANILEKNPYQMVDDIEGIGFITADKIADKIGFDKQSRFRITAAITYCLNDLAGKNGHTYYPKDKLCYEVANLMGIKEISFYERVKEVIEDCLVMGKVIVIELQDYPVVMLTKNYLTEISIANKIAKMLNESANILLDMDSDIANYQNFNKIILHEGQISAIKNCISVGVNVITGGPGTGKTTIVKCIISLLKSKGLSVGLCAPTGRAAKRLYQATGEDARTIHRMLELNFKEGSNGNFAFNEQTTLAEDVIIVDEVSMCDEYVFNSLIKAIKKGGRLIMVGDKDQLPSVGAGNVLSDIIKSNCVPVNYLTQIYRQGEDSNIISNAHLINKSTMPIIDNKSKDFFFDNQASQSDILQTIVQMVTTRLPKYSGLKPFDIQVLCPMKKGIAGVENVNATLQDVINPTSDKKKQIKIGTKVFREGDKIIHIVNNYQMEWQNPKDGTVGVGVFNGDIGIIIAIQPKELIITIEFEDGKIASYKQSNLDEITLAYAISIHKSQGSEFDVVLLALTGGNYMIMTKNLLYTAITRAKQMVVIVGDIQSLEKMVKNDYTAKRYTLLSSFIKEQILLCKKQDTMQ